MKRLLALAFAIASVFAASPVLAQQVQSGAVLIAQPGKAVCVIVTGGTIGIAGISGTYTVF